MPEGVWIGDLSRRHDGTRFRVLAALGDEAGGVALTEVTGDRLDAVLGEARTADAVVETEVLRRSERTALVQFETETPLLMLAARRSGVPVETPFELVDGEVTWEVTASRDRLSELGAQLEAFGVPFDVEAVRPQVAEETLLTDRQATVVGTAVDRGYYETPRECTLTELAEALGVAKSTCSETLHRAEGKIVKRFVGDRDAGPGADPTLRG